MHAGNNNYIWNYEKWRFSNMFLISWVDIKANNNNIYIKDLLCAGYCYTTGIYLLGIHNNPTR